MKVCPGACGLMLSEDAFPRNRTGACLACHRQASRRAYSQRKALRAAEAVLAAEEALWQLWSLACSMCGEEELARRRATARPLQLLPGEVRCGRCGSATWGSLVSGPATLEAAQPEIERQQR